MTPPPQEKHCPTCGLKSPCPTCSKPRLAVATACACDEHGPCLEHESEEAAVDATLDVVDEVTRLRAEVARLTEERDEALAAERRKDADVDRYEAEGTRLKAQLATVAERILSCGLADDLTLRPIAALFRAPHEPVKCAMCGKPATCIGAYEHPDNEEQPSCDDCCGHGNEDGYCEPLVTEGE